MTYAQIHAMTAEELKAAIAAKRDEVKAAKAAEDAQGKEAIRLLKTQLPIDQLTALDAQTKALRKTTMTSITELDDLKFELEDRS